MSPSSSSPRPTTPSRRPPSRCSSAAPSEPPTRCFISRDCSTAARSRGWTRPAQPSARFTRCKQSWTRARPRSVSRAPGPASRVTRGPSRPGNTWPNGWGCDRCGSRRHRSRCTTRPRSLVANYTVSLAGVAERLARPAGVPQDLAGRIYLPLLAGAAENLRSTTAAAALTGPLRRGDVETVRRHLDSLPADVVPLYRLLGLEALALARAEGLDPATAERLQPCWQAHPKARRRRVWSAARSRSRPGAPRAGTRSRTACQPGPHGALSGHSMNRRRFSRMLAALAGGTAFQPSRAHAAAPEPDPCALPDAIRSLRPLTGWRGADRRRRAPDAH